MTSQEIINILNSIPHIDKRYMHTKRTQDIIYSYCGKELAHYTRLFTRNKCTSINIFIQNDCLDFLKSRNLIQK